jgi:HSP20 family protein
MTPGWNPFNSLASFRRDMDALFNRFFGDWERERSSWGPIRVGYAPHLESYVEGNTLHVKVDLPGIDPKEVELAVEGNQLTISGERKAEQERKENDYLHQEVQYGSFARTVTLPEGVQADNIHATYHGGVLEVTIPLPRSMVAKKVPIQTEGETPRQITA